MNRRFTASGAASVTAAALLLAASAARAEDAPSVEKSAEATPSSLDLRLTLSSFLYREVGEDAPALVDQGAPLESASPVKRYFGDLRVELGGGGVTLDARVRQTTSQRFQSGASGGGEYEIRALSYRLGGPARSLAIGRQYVDGVAGSKIDGLAFRQRLVKPVTATLFAGAFPVLGSRSLETDYPTIRMEDGSDGARLVPLAGGLGFGIETASYHGDLGVAAVYIPQTVPMATTQEASRVFTSASGYLRAGTVAEVYHFLLLDIAGQNRTSLTNGSLGVTLHPTPVLQVGASVNHVSTDALQIATRNLLEDPDPTAIGIVQNNIAVIRVSQDAARATASLALAHQRFEISAAGGVHRRPEVSVRLSDGSGAVAFPEARNIDASFAILDRRSIGGTRLSLMGSLTQPLGDTAPNAARGTTLRAAGSKAFARERGQLEIDLMIGRFRTLGGSGDCTTSLEVLTCYGLTRTQLAQVGALASWRVSREWLVLADAHVGYRDSTSSTLAGQIVWPHLYTVSGFVRAQWRFH
ncbi:MAG: hypothetical protein IPQ07_05515 [Myxococcales bacterium]|nr:hypothetical protein [Myxococcales bacterium]